MLHQNQQRNQLQNLVKSEEELMMKIQNSNWQKNGKQRNGKSFLINLRNKCTQLQLEMQNLLFSKRFLKLYFQNIFHHVIYNLRNFQSYHKSLSHFAITSLSLSKVTRHNSTDSLIFLVTLTSVAWVCRPNFAELAAFDPLRARCCFTILIAGTLFALIFKLVASFTAILHIDRFNPLKLSTQSITKP